MQSWLYLAGLMMISAYVLLWLRLRRARALLTGLPSYPELPLLGNLLQLVGDSRSLFHLLQDISEKADETKKPFLLWIATYPVLVFSDPDDVRAITNSFLEKPYYYNFGKEWLGDGLVTAPAEIWKKNIKKLAGTFNAGVVESYQMVFNEHAQKLAQNLKGQVGAKPFDVMHLLAVATLETICQTAFGVPEISNSITTAEYYEAFNRALELLIRRGLNVLVHPDWIYRLTSDHTEYLKCIAVLHKVAETVLKKTMSEREMNKNNEKSISDKARVNRFKPFIEILLDVRAGDPLLMEYYIKSEMNTVIVGGQETTATTLYYALLMIGCEPKVQQKLYEEMESIFGGTLRLVTKEDLREMRYCEAVIYEVLRLYPPLPGVIRLSDREIQLESCRVPKNAMCCINAWGAGRSRRAWGPRALHFDPERWLGDSAPRDNAAFLPFSYGRRACIGKKYAISLLKTMLAYCIRELEFSSEAHQLDFKLDIALRPVSGHLIQVKLRDS